MSQGSSGAPLGLLPVAWPHFGKKLTSAELVLGVFAVGFGVGLGNDFCQEKGSSMKYWVRVQKAWVQIQALPLCGCVTLGK